MGQYVQVATTVSTKEDAELVARMLVEKGLAACVQVIGPIVSFYRWRGEVETAGEYLCLAKSRPGLFPAIEAAIKEIHPYEVPELIASPLVAGSSDYLAWLDGQLSGRQGEDGR